MLTLIIFLSCIFIALAAGLLAAISDIRTLTIPNQYSIIIIATFAVAFFSLWLLGRDDVFAPLLSHVLSAVIVFVLTGVLFALKLLGAGDSKFATAFALWTGLVGLMPFLFYMALTGAALGIAALALRRWKPIKAPQEGSWIARVQAGESKVPYGVAIAVGALAGFLKIGYFSIETLHSFLLV